MSFYQMSLDSHWNQWANEVIDNLHGCLGGKIIKRHNDDFRWKELQIGEYVFSLDIGSKDDIPEEENHYWLDVKHATAGKFCLQREGWESLKQTVSDIGKWTVEQFAEHVAQSR